MPRELAPGARRLRLTVGWDGTDYHGWQRQANAPTVQAALEAAYATMTGDATAIRGASRTDAGVHADGQVAQVDTTTNIKVYNFYRGLNSLLPHDITVHHVCEVDAEFEVLENRGKLYRYWLWCGRVDEPKLRRYAWRVQHRLDVALMRSAALHLVGTHDFAAFRAADCERKTTMRTLHRVELVRRGNLLQVEIEGSGFLKNMVRIITGTLVEIGAGRLAPDHTRSLLTVGDRRSAGPTAPAHGLTLVKVLY